MYNLSLTACSFFLQKTNSKKAADIYALNRPLITDSTAGVKISVVDLFELFFQNCAEIRKDSNKQQSFSCDLSSEHISETDDYKMICVRMLSGIYGSSSDILDGNTHKLKYRKKSTDIDTRPFYVFVVIPKDSEKVVVQKGILIFQNVGPFGIKTITTENMQAFFSETFQISLKCRTIAPELFVRKVIKREYQEAHNG